MFYFDNFDIDQMPSKFAQRQYFVCEFYCEKIYDVGRLDNAENAKRNCFLTTLYINVGPKSNKNPPVMNAKLWSHACR